ncbi:uncharacterized protein E0L32_004361 [Thyridium curvatum]|uniref:Ankyrin repeat protein n=1 Tax=Thyridium curvatum TaxID=1093900 RepID=A0A507BEK1_9PEZI|nr:uncharacterized protein E0L32_004361 [Thyridium curvatum]TPX15381.1 hypothetical protein E0L32_004361 [Thyridium curvatum]
MDSYGLPPLPAPTVDVARLLAENPDQPLPEFFEPYRKFEAELRQLYAQGPDAEILKDHHINVVPLFTEHTGAIKVRARDVENEPDQEKEKYIMALPKDRRRPNGSPATVGSLQDFRRNFNVFCESSMAEMNWDNVVVAGSAVVNCLLPVPDEFSGSKRSLREYYHEKFCPASDVDLFLYGLSEEEAVEKIKQIESCIRDSILTETTTVRTKHAITICSQYPTRHIQIVLRIYKSISEILTGFDIDCSGAAYDGKQVYCTPRALQAYMTQLNQIDLTRRSPSYENRLSKYSHRNFEVYWPDLDRSRIDPTIFERSFQRTLGLARLLVLEQLPTTTAREQYRSKRRAERGRPPLNNSQQHVLYGNIKDSFEDEVAEWVDAEDVSNYHTFTIPYGQKFHAKKIEKLCYTRDLLLNAEWNQPKDREVHLHRHPAFFGRFEDVIHDCCGFCPKAETEQELEVAEQENKIYVSGEISFIKDDPGRQQIGSFNPLTDDDWTEMAYVGNTSRLCQDIVDGNLEHVQDWLAQEGADPNKRDYTGRTPLHLAVTSSTPEIVRCLVNAGARLVARLADGKTALHLAAERGNLEMVKILMEKSLENEAEEEEKQDKRRAATTNPAGAKGTEKEDVVVSDTPNKEEIIESDESEEESGDESEESDLELLEDDESEADVQSMATGSFVKVGKKAQADPIPDENEDEPDFYDVNVLAWDHPCSALHLAIVSGHHEVVKLLCQEYGADVLLPIKFLGYNNQQTGALLTLVLALALPLDKAKTMVQTLLDLGATCAQADTDGFTAFHRFAEENAATLIELLFELDKSGSKTAVNFFAFPTAFRAVSPLQAAMTNGDVRLVIKLLEAGAAPQVEFETWLKAAKQSGAANRLSTLEENKKMLNESTEQPLITALRSTRPASAIELIKHGADVNAITTTAYGIFARSWWRGYDRGESALDLVQKQLGELRKYKGETPREPVDITKDADKYLQDLKEGTWQHWLVHSDYDEARNRYALQMREHAKEVEKAKELKGLKEKKEAIAEAIADLEKIEKMILEKGGKHYDDLYPDFKNKKAASSTTDSDKTTTHYNFKVTFSGAIDVTEARRLAYIELFEAAWRGDLGKIKELTLGAWGVDDSEPPLKIAVKDNKNNNPFSLAFLRGHYDVARAILEIAKAQYVPEDEKKERFRLKRNDDYDCSDGSDCEYYEGEGDEPSIHREEVVTHFTIENVGEVVMQVKSRTKPLEMLSWGCPSFTVRDGKVENLHFGSYSLFRAVIQRNDHAGLKFLLDTGAHYTAQKLDQDDEPNRIFAFPQLDFDYAIEEGRVEMLAEIIKRTGAGLPLEDLVKRSGVEIKDKPRYYQGLTVYGKKRSDWAQAGRNVVSKPIGNKASPLLHAAMAGCIESVEWFLSDSPIRQYQEFSKSKAAQHDSRLKHLTQAPGGFDAQVKKWLGNQSDLVIHALILGPTGTKSNALLEHLIKAYPSSVTAKSQDGHTPLMLAALLGRTDFAKILIKNGADQSTKDAKWNNLAHGALQSFPEAEPLGAFLKLLDPDLLGYMLKERNSLTFKGQSPMHSWIARCFDDDNSKQRYEDVDKAIAVLKLLLSYSKGKELELLDGAGDTVLHTLIANDADPKIIRALLDFNPDLLYRENAVGRTPAEVAGDRFTAAHFRNLAYNSWAYMREQEGLAKKDVEDFVGDKARLARNLRGEEKDKLSRLRRGQIWDLVKEYLAQFPGRRRLVSLHEANDVARRLGNEYLFTRYYDRKRRGDRESEPREDNEDEDEDNGGNEATEELDEFGNKKKKAKVEDIVKQILPTMQQHAWKPYKEPCEKCGLRHDKFPRLWRFWERDDVSNHPFAVEPGSAVWFARGAAVECPIVLKDENGKE